MSSTKPDGYVNCTAMAHGPSERASANARAAAAPDLGTRPAPVSEQDAERAEKVRSHASSHRTAGTAFPDL